MLHPLNMKLKSNAQMQPAMSRLLDQGKSIQQALRQTIVGLMPA
jgi:hypothetical protein